MRLVLDTNVVLSAFLWNGLPKQLMQIVRSTPIRIFTSTALLDELADVLSRPKFDRKLAESSLTAERLVALYATFCDVVDPVSLIGIAPDPDDDVVIGTALAAGANLIVTGDKPLLSVLTYKGIRIVSVDEALRIVSPVADLLPK